MVYVEKLVLPSLDRDQCYESGSHHISFYPYHVLSSRGLFNVVFDDITLITGGNGTGKSTLLNVIAQKLHLRRQTPFNKTEHLRSYLGLCRIGLSDNAVQMPCSIKEYGRIITSDEVFDHIIEVRLENEEIDKKRNKLISEYDSLKSSGIPRHISMDDKKCLNQISKQLSIRRTSKFRYIKDNGGLNILEQSNGETALKYFTETIKPDGLYLLDEPENSLSAEKQKDLAYFIESMARFEHCQFIISTHSPFLMCMKWAKLYNLDVHPAAVMPWTEVESVRTYYDFFKEHESEFVNASAPDTPKNDKDNHGDTTEVIEDNQDDKC